MQKILGNKWVLLLIISFTWGSSFILIKRSLVIFNFWEIGAFRVALSGLLLLFLGVPVLKRLDRKTLMWVITSGFFGNFLPMFLFPLAQMHVSSAMAGILDSLVPVFVLALGYIFFGIRSRLVQIMGAVAGFAGAFLLMYFSDSATAGSQIGYGLLIVLATACYGMSSLLVKEKLAHVPSMQLSAAVYTIWMIPSLMILFISGFFGRLQGTPPLEALGYLSVLSIFGTAVAMILYYKLIQSTTAVFASTATYLLPLVAVIWGLLDGERFTIWYVIGGALILWGIYLIREATPAAADTADAISRESKALPVQSFTDGEHEKLQ